MQEHLGELETRFKREGSLATAINLAEKYKEEGLDVVGIGLLQELLYIYRGSDLQEIVLLRLLEAIAKVDEWERLEELVRVGIKKFGEKVTYKYWLGMVAEKMGNWSGVTKLLTEIKKETVGGERIQDWTEKLAGLDERQQTRLFGKWGIKEEKEIIANAPGLNKLLGTIEMKITAVEGEHKTLIDRLIDGGKINWVNEFHWKQEQQQKEFVEVKNLGGMVPYVRNWKPRITLKSVERAQKIKDIGSRETRLISGYTEEEGDYIQIGDSTDKKVKDSWDLRSENLEIQIALVYLFGMIYGMEGNWLVRLGKTMQLREGRQLCKECK